MVLLSMQQQQQLLLPSMEQKQQLLLLPCSFVRSSLHGRVARKRGSESRREAGGALACLG